MRIETRIPTLCVASVALLIFVADGFRFAEILGVKRVVQGVLIVPAALGAIAYIATRPRGLFNPMVAFLVVRVATEIAWRGELPYIADGLLELVAFVVLTSAPARSARAGIKVVVWTATAFAALTVMQQVIMFWWPGLDADRLIISDDGDLLSGGGNLVSWFGLCSGQNGTIWGHEVARCASFVREPSLVYTYFLLPASLALMINDRATKFAFGVLLACSMFSLSGTAWLSLAFAVCCWLLSKSVAIRRIYPAAMLLVAAVLVYTIREQGLDFLLAAFQRLGEINELLIRTRSITDRLGPAVMHLDEALASPFGSPELTDWSGPWFIHVALATGWLGVLLLAAFLVLCGRRLGAYYQRHRLNLSSRIATFLYCGVMTTVLVFNDYKMISYSGLVLLMFLYRATGPDNVLVPEQRRARVAATGSRRRHSSSLQPLEIDGLA